LEEHDKGIDNLVSHSLLQENKSQTKLHWLQEENDLYAEQIIEHNAQLKQSKWFIQARDEQILNLSEEVSETQSHYLPVKIFHFSGHLH
jgi:hypothetical protein